MAEEEESLRSFAKSGSCCERIFAARRTAHSVPASERSILVSVVLSG